MQNSVKFLPQNQPDQVRQPVEDESHHEIENPEDQVPNPYYKPEDRPQQDQDREKSHQPKQTLPGPFRVQTESEQYAHHQAAHVRHVGYARRKLPEVNEHGLHHRVQYRYHAERQGEHVEIYHLFRLHQHREPHETEHAS